MFARLQKRQRTHEQCRPGVHNWACGQDGRRPDNHELAEGSQRRDDKCGERLSAGLHASRCFWQPERGAHFAQLAEALALVRTGLDEKHRVQVRQYQVGRAGLLYVFDEGHAAQIPEYLTKHLGK